MVKHGGRSKLLGEAILLHTDKGDVLVQRLTITCPDCGTGRIEIAGHHLRQIHQVLGETIAAHPELCGGPAGEAERTQFEIGHTSPEKAKLN